MELHGPLVVAHAKWAVVRSLAGPGVLRDGVIQVREGSSLAASLAYRQEFLIRNCEKRSARWQGHRVPVFYPGTNFGVCTVSLSGAARAVIDAIPRYSDDWEACRTDKRDPQEAMESFHSWVKRQEKSRGTPVLGAFPAAYDAMWVQWYLHRFVGEDPFRRRAIDIKTLAMVAMGAGYRAATKRACQNTGARPAATPMSRWRTRSSRVSSS